MKKAKSMFPQYAEEAAKLERMGKFNNAAFAWAGAAHHARTPQNRAWAEARSDFCNHWNQERCSKEAA